MPSLLTSLTFFYVFFSPWIEMFNYIPYNIPCLYIFKMKCLLVHVPVHSEMSIAVLEMKIWIYWAE